MAGAAATTEPSFYVSYGVTDARKDFDSIANNSGSLNGATPVTLVAAPSGGNIRHDVRDLTIFNLDTQANMITIRVDTGAKFNIWKGLVPSGGSVTLNATSIIVYDANGIQTTSPDAVLSTFEDAKLVWTSITTVTLGTIGNDSVVSDSLRKNLIRWNGALSAVITTAGVGGLDTGSEAADTWYATHIIGDMSGVNAPVALLSLSATAPTLPAGYDIFRRVGWVRNDSSSDLLKFFQCGSGRSRRYYYDETRVTTEVLGTASATAFTSVDCSSFIPPTSQCGRFYVSFEVGTSGADGDAAEIRPDGSSVTNPTSQFRPSNAVSTVKQTWAPVDLITDVNQSIEYAVSQGGASQNQLTLSVIGWEDSL